MSQKSCSGSIDGDSQDLDDNINESQKDNMGGPTKSIKKHKKMFMCTFNGCGKSYSHTSGIRHHQREKHGQYNPEFYEKVDQTKSSEKRGRPKLQIKKEIQETYIQEFFEKLQQQEEQEMKNNPEKRKQIQYEDKMMSFLLEKNIKFVLAVITEFGDPITNKCRNNLFIEEWDTFQNDPWKAQEEKPIDWENFFCKNSFMSLVQQQQNGNLEQDENNEESERQIHERKMREFVSRIFQDLKDEVQMDYFNIFKLAWDLKFNHNLSEEQVVQEIQKGQSNYRMFDPVEQGPDAELTISDFLEHILHGTFAYVLDTPNVLYDKYFGYANI